MVADRSKPSAKVKYRPTDVQSSNPGDAMNFEIKELYVFNSSLKASTIVK